MSRMVFAGIAGGLLGGLGYVVDRSAGAVAISAIVTVVVALGARLAAAPRPAQPAHMDRAPSPTGFPSHSKILVMMRWTQTNGRYYDVVTRPFLVATAAALLADRHRLDLHRNTREARELIGHEGWDLLQPEKPRDRDDPVGLDPVAALVDRLEDL
jgi:hypothetical protein